MRREREVGRDGKWGGVGGVGGGEVGGGEG